jgi:hypothetical protein
MSLPSRSSAVRRPAKVLRRLARLAPEGATTAQIAQQLARSVDGRTQASASVYKAGAHNPALTCRLSTTEGR